MVMIGPSRNAKINHRMRAMRWAILGMVTIGWAAGAHAAPCLCTDVFVGEAQPFIAEGIAHDAAANRFLIASVATRRIVTIHDGRQSAFARLPDDYSPLGIALSGDTLWVTAATLPQGAGHDGPSALIAIDKNGGRVRQVYPVPDKGNAALNDLAFAPDGAIYASDSLSGALYRLPPGAAALIRMTATLKSPQGMAVSADGTSLLVADYSLGLVKLDLASTSLAPLRIPDGVNVKGIDGLARLPDGSFIASQNGLKKPRILRLSLSPDWTRVRSLDVVAADDSSVADPSLVTADRSGAYVVGVSQWASFGNGPTPVRTLQPWRIVKLTLSAVR
jgi:sugar lactone lactonase YvrE